MLRLSLAMSIIRPDILLIYQPHIKTTGVSGQARTPEVSHSATLKQLVNLFSKSIFCSCTYLLVHQLSIFKEQNGWNVTDSKF